MPVILIELVLVFGGVLAFAVWQLRSVARDRERTHQQRAQREALQALQTHAAQDTPQSSDSPSALGHRAAAAPATATAQAPPVDGSPAAGQQAARPGTVTATPGQAGQP